LFLPLPRRTSVHPSFTAASASQPPRVPNVAGSVDAHAADDAGQESIYRLSPDAIRTGFRRVWQSQPDRSYRGEYGRDQPDNIANAESIPAVEFDECEEKDVFFTERLSKESSHDGQHPLQIESQIKKIVARPLTSDIHPCRPGFMQAFDREPLHPEQVVQRHCCTSVESNICKHDGQISISIRWENPRSGQELIGIAYRTIFAGQCCAWIQ